MDRILGYLDKQSYLAGDEVKIYSHYPADINFIDVSNSWLCNQKVTIEKNFNITIRINQNNSTPGILLPNIKIPLSKNILRINYKIQTNIQVTPLVRDLSANIYYWTNNKKYIIESGLDYIILNLPPNIPFINIYLLANGKFSFGDQFVLENFSLYFMQSSILPMQIKIYDIYTNILNVYTTNNIISQRFKMYSFANGCDWISNFSFCLSPNLKSGYYFLKIIYGGKDFSMVFIIKPQFYLNKIVILANNAKLNAYNNWGGLDGNFSLYEYNPSNSYIPDTKLCDVFSGTKVTNTLSICRPNITNSIGITAIMGKKVAISNYFNTGIYGEMFLPYFLNKQNISYDIINDMDMDLINYNDISKCKIFILHVHPEYWSANQLDLLRKLNFNGTGIMYLGGNGIYWKTLWTGKQMYVNKTKGFFSGEEITKVFYSHQYDTSKQFNFPYKIFGIRSELFANLDLSNNYFGFQNLNSTNINSGSAGFETDIVISTNYQKYIIAKTDDNFCHMIWKPQDSNSGAVFSSSSLTFTGSLLVDTNISKLVINVIKKIDPTNIFVIGLNSSIK